MRLWTLHPQYLDAQGLVALWREALLAQKVLQGATRGYKHHPQLRRFQASSDPSAAIAAYLAGVLQEGERRGYSFDADRISGMQSSEAINATEGQLLYEWRHLMCKLERRDPRRYKSSQSTKVPAPHPLFRVVAGEVHDWERVK